MKKYTILLATIILAFAACNKEDNAPETPSVSKVPFTFSGTMEELTKTEVSENTDGSAAVLWKSTDKVSVFDAEGTNCEFSVSGAGATATLSGELVPSQSGEYYAVYPYSASGTLVGTTLSATIPEVQKVTGPGFADGAVVSAAKVSGNAGTFSNMASLVRFTVPSDVTTLKSVTLSSTAPLSGEFVMDFAGGTPAVTTVPDLATTVRIEMEDGSVLPAGNYYAAVLPGTHKLTVTLTDKDGMTAERSMDGSKEFLSSHIRGIGSVKADTFDNVEFVLGDAAVSGETKTLIMSAKIPAGTYTVEQLLGVTSYPYKGDKAIYVIRNVSFTVESTTERQTVTIPKAALTARHLLVREGDDLQAVLNAAEAGLDDVYVGAGTFTGGFTMVKGINVTGSWDADFTGTINYEPLKSTSGITTILDGGGSQRVVNQAAAFTESTVTTWKNLKIQNGKRSSDNGAGVYLRSRGVLDGCEICNNSASEGTSQGGGVWAAEGSFVRNCWIHGNFAQHTAGGIYCKGQLTYSLIENNSAQDNAGGGVQMHGGNAADNNNGTMYNCIVRRNSSANGGGIRLYGVTQVANCLVLSNTATSGGVSGILVNGQTSILNCTLVKNYDAATSAGNSSALYCNQNGTIKNCLFFGNYSSSKDADSAVQLYINHKYTWLINNAITDGGLKLHAQYDPSGNGRNQNTQTIPAASSGIFNNYDGDDYTLTKSATMCIDKGNTNIFGFMTTDLAYKARKVNTVDIGCYEYQQ